MKKTFLALAILVGSTHLFAQDAPKDAAPTEGWSRKGKISFLLNQSAFNNDWTGGGVSSIAGNLSLDYKFNYKKGFLSWDNIILADYGMTKLKTDDFARKTNDRFDFNSVVSRDIEGSNWKYSFFMNFKTQMDSGFEDTKTEVKDSNGNPVTYIDVNGKPVNLMEITQEKRSHFFSPAYLQLGPGMLWEKSKNLFVNISPATSKFIFVHKDFTDSKKFKKGVTVDSFNKAGGYFGVEANKSFRFEFGASLTAYAKFDLMKNISMENILKLYTNYLQDPQNVDIDYTANIAMTINKYLSANIAFQAVYDDNAVGSFQIREVFGLGVNYIF